MRKIIVFIDGASRGNPGSASIGVVFCNEKGQAFKKYSEYLGERITNNEAEYQALIFALKKFKSLLGKELAKTAEIEIRSDSELLIKQIKGEYKVLDGKIQSLFITVWNLRTDFGQIKFTIIPREKNSEADALANEALDNKNKNQPLF